MLGASFAAAVASAGSLAQQAAMPRADAGAERQARAAYEMRRAAAHERVSRASEAVPQGVVPTASPHPAWFGARPALAAEPDASHAYAAAMTAASAGTAPPALEHHLPFFPSAARAAGAFVRVVNGSAEAGQVAIVAVDDAGERFGPVSLAIAGHAAVHLDAADLQYGNAAKGLAQGVGQPTEGDWRLVLTSSLDIRALAYSRTLDGLIASLHERIPKQSGVRRLALFHAADSGQASLLRLSNAAGEPATVAIRGVDDGGTSANEEVRVTMPAGAAFTLSAADLEAGSAVGEGAFGGGNGAWRLTLAADRPVRAVHLVVDADGDVANLSSPPVRVVRDAESELALHRIPYFPAESAAGDGVLRFVNDGRAAGVVEIRAFDQTERAIAPVTMAVRQRAAEELSSADLVYGNAAKGMSGGIGDSEGPWRLELATTLPGRASAYFRSAGGALANLDAAAPATVDEGGVYRAALPFFPSSEGAVGGLLRLVNWQHEDAAVTISARDDRGVPAHSTVRLTVPAGRSRTLTVQQLETGDGDGLRGAFGGGAGHWRLDVATSVAVQVLGLHTSNGRLANISTTPPPEDPSAAGIFAAHISPVVQRQCVNCHVAGGLAANARLIFTPAAASPDHQALNLLALTAFLAEVDDGAAVLLNRVQGVGHGGGVQLPAGTEDHVYMAQLLAGLGETLADPPAVANLFDAVQLEAPRSTLRRAALVFAGRLPTAAEYAAVETGNLAALRRTVRGLMQGEGFHAFLLRASNDRLLTDRELARGAVIDNAGFFVNYDNEYVRRRQEGGRQVWDWHNRVQYGAARAPLELIAHVVQNDLPYTDVLTADYIMANPTAAWVYGAATAFDDPNNPHEFKPSTIDSYYRHGPGYRGEYLPGIGWRVVDAGPLITIYPHAGLLNTTAFLQRYPSTATNRNRARSRWTYYHFLGVDIEKSASRTTDPAALADTNNPTLKNPACTVCHSRLDPVAGAFQNYGDAGYYRDQWGGFDALDGFYKSAADRAQAIHGNTHLAPSTLAWPLRLPAGEATVGFTYTNDFYDEETNYDGAIYVDYLRVLNRRGQEVARHEFETAPPVASWGPCGEPGWNSATEANDHLHLWNGGHECAVHVSLDVAEAGEHTVEVAAWGTRHDGYGTEGYPKVSVALNPYRIGDTWFRDMRPPGFREQPLPNSDDSLPWLARRIVADERFAAATVRFWWPAVMGQEVTEPPASEEDAQLAGRLLAANAQEAEVQRLARGFRNGFAGGSAYNLKDLLTELALSNWFRAESTSSLGDLQAEALRDAGARRLLTPEELSRKTAAATGFEWGRWEHPGEPPHRQHTAKLTDDRSYRLLYGGIDSDGIAVRAREMTSVMAGVAKAHAAQASCPVVLRELYVLPNEERRLFGDIEASVSPRFELGGRFDVDATSATHTLRGELTPGRKTVFLKFPNDAYSSLGDSNLFLDRLILRDATGQTVQTVELETFATPVASDCNQPQGDHFAFFCRGWLKVPIVVEAAGAYALDVIAWGDLHGDEPPQLQVVVEAATATSVGETAMKRQLVTLHEKLLGLQLGPGAAEIEDAYRLFNEVWQRKRRSAEPWFAGQACHWGDDVRFFDGIVADAVGEREGEHGPYKHWRWSKLEPFWNNLDTADPHFAARTWVVVLAYLMMDYRYLHQ